MVVLAGLAWVVVSALIALEVPAEVIAGFNVDGLALVGMAVGAALILRGLLRSGSELPMAEPGTATRRASSHRTEPGFDF